MADELDIVSTLREKVEAKTFPDTSCASTSLSRIAASDVCFD